MNSAVAAQQWVPPQNAGILNCGL